jgi:DNA-binding NtrC family response regulator
MDGTRVLIVDDEADFVEMLSMRMSNRGLIVDSALSGPEALQLIDKNEYDAVVLDLAMPKMDGLETLKRMLSVNPNLQVILLTGHATVDKGVEAIKSGAFEFLEKPVKIDALLNRVEEARARRAALSETKIEDMIDEIVKRRGW